MPAKNGSWKADGVYVFLAKIFPEYRTRRGNLDVPKLCSKLKKSTETIYKWFRSDRLTPANAEAICELVNSDAENVAALARRDREPPKIEDFNRFVYRMT